MKRIMTLVLAIIIVCSMAACGSQSSKSDETNTQQKVDSTVSEIEETDRTLESDDQETVPSASTIVDDAASEKLCYLPTEIIFGVDYPESAASKLGQTPGYHEETSAVFVYDDAGRLVNYHSYDGQFAMSIQYLGEIALPSECGLGDGTIIRFMNPRWSEDNSEILLDVCGGGLTIDEINEADFKLSQIELNSDGRLSGALITWESGLGDEVYYYCGYAFDEYGNLTFATDPKDEFHTEYKYLYGNENNILGFECYWTNDAGVSQLDTAACMSEDGSYFRVENGLESSNYALVGIGRYRHEYDGNWSEVVFDENGNLSEYIWYAASSGITYTYKVNYMTMSESQYTGTPVTYSDIYPMLQYNAFADNYVEAAGMLQIPISIDPIMLLYFQ